jgi:hypothetical protein
LPPAQLAHEGAPATAEYVPATQFEHAGDPTAAAYCPLAHAAHAAAPATDDWPAAHPTHTDDTVAPVPRAKLPLAHCTQTAAL